MNAPVDLSKVLKVSEARYQVRVDELDAEDSMNGLKNPVAARQLWPDCSLHRTYHTPPTCVVCVSARARIVTQATTTHEELQESCIALVLLEVDEGLQSGYAIQTTARQDQQASQEMLGRVKGEPSTHIHAMKTSIKRPPKKASARFSAILPKVALGSRESRGETRKAVVGN